LGSSGYIGRAFAQALRESGAEFKGLSRQELDYTSFADLRAFLEKMRPEFLINAAGFTGKPNVDACETARADTLRGNTLLPLTISHACQIAGVPWGQVSSGCIYNGAKILENGQVRIEPDLTKPGLQELIRIRPESVLGFLEEDEPNFSFRRPPCSFYSGSKALAEEALRQDPQVYIWRLRIPFDELDDPRNYLTKLQTYPKVYDNVNSISHRGDFVRACLDMWRRRAPFGTYNLTNPGYVTARQVVAQIRQILAPQRQFEFWSGDAEFYAKAVKAPRSNCVLEVGKVLAAGTRLRPAAEAVADALKNWRKAS
jgi:dTDP-4-dehydrorhamnose reductase